MLEYIGCCELPKKLKLLRSVASLADVLRHSSRVPTRDEAPRNLRGRLG